MKDNKYYLCKNIVVLTYIVLPTLKNGIPLKSRQRKYNKFSNRSFTAITLKATNCFNIETHHM